MDNKAYKYNGYTYEEEGNRENDGVRIIHNKPYPEKVHKFYSFNSNNVDALINGYFYASHTFELNDFLDSSPFLWYASKPLSLEFYECFLDKSIPRDELLEFYKKDTEVEHLCKSYISHFWNKLSNLNGIISLTENEKSLLMWPHYTQEKGFQLTYNAQTLETSLNEKIGNGECFGMFPINYTPYLNPIDISEFKNMLIPFFYATNIKSDNWEYEQEWRFLIGKCMMGVPNSKMGLNTYPDIITYPHNRYTYYDINTVEQITLGMNFFTTQDFKMEWLSLKQFKVSPIKSNKNPNYEIHKKLLSYIYENLKEKIFHSGTKYEEDENGDIFLIRTKERLEIERVVWDTYVFTRTDDILRIF